MLLFLSTMNVLLYSQIKLFISEKSRADVDRKELVQHCEWGSLLPLVIWRPWSCLSGTAGERHFRSSHPQLNRWTKFWRHLSVSSNLRKPRQFSLTRNNLLGSFSLKWERSLLIPFDNSRWQREIPFYTYVYSFLSFLWGYVTICYSPYPHLYLSDICWELEFCSYTYIARKPLSITQSILSLLTAELAQPKSLRASFLVWMDSNVLTITGKNNREKMKTLNIHLSRLFLTWKGKKWGQNFDTF